MRRSTATSRQLATRVGGTVVKVTVVDNQYVEAGTVVAQIDPRDYQVAVDRARAELADAEATASAAGTGVPIAEVSTRSDVQPGHRRRGGSAGRHRRGRQPGRGGQGTAGRHRGAAARARSDRNQERPRRRAAAAARREGRDRAAAVRRRRRHRRRRPRRRRRGEVGRRGREDGDCRRAAACGAGTCLRRAGAGRPADGAHGAAAAPGHAARARPAPRRA